jgi:hypothetical protein
VRPFIGTFQSAEGTDLDLPLWAGLPACAFRWGGVDHQPLVLWPLCRHFSEDAVEHPQPVTNGQSGCRWSCAARTPWARHASAGRS